MPNNIKILSVIESLGRGGAERVLLNTLPELKKQGLDCEVVILFEEDDLVQGFESNGIKVHRLNLSYKWNFVEAITKLNKLIKKNHYDIIHAHLFFAYFYTGLAKLFNQNVITITTFHNLGFDEYPANTTLKKIRKTLDRAIVKKCFDRTTAVSAAVKEHYEKHFRLTNVDVIFNSFPINTFQEYKNDKAEGVLESYVHIKRDDFIILTPGRFVEKKGHKYLIKAIKILNRTYPNFIFLFVGKGPLANKLKEHSPPNVKIISEVPHSELMKIYNNVDLIVIPSIYEAFGLVVGEGMVMEKGIVATKVDGIIEMITNEREGLLVSSRDPDALAKAIEKMYIDYKLRANLVKNAKEKIKQFDTRLIAKQWKAYYEGLLSD